MVAAAVAVAVAAGLVWSVVQFAADNPEKANLGDPVFRVGRAERLAREVDDRGPFLFQDPLARGGGRNVYIQHLGDDPDTGWLAIEARLPHEPGCAVTWDRSRELFVDCNGEGHPPAGGDLRTYAGAVEEGQVRIDLRTRARPEGAAR